MPGGVFVNLERDKSESNFIGNFETKSARALMKLVINYFDEISNNTRQQRSSKLVEKYAFVREQLKIRSKGVAG